MTHSLSTAIQLDGVGSCRDAARTFTWLRRQGSDGATRNEIRRALHVGYEAVQRALTALLDAGLVEVVPETGHVTRWRAARGDR